VPTIKTESLEEIRKSSRLFLDPDFYALPVQPSIIYDRSCGISI